MMQSRVEWSADSGVKVFPGETDHVSPGIEIIPGYRQPNGDLMSDGFVLFIPWIRFQDVHMKLDGTLITAIFQSHDLTITGEYLDDVRVALKRGLISRIEPSTKNQRFNSGERHVFIETVKVEKHNPYKEAKEQRAAAGLDKD